MLRTEIPTRCEDVTRTKWFLRIKKPTIFRCENKFSIQTNGAKKMYVCVCIHTYLFGARLKEYECNTASMNEEE